MEIDTEKEKTNGRNYWRERKTRKQRETGARVGHTIAELDIREGTLGRQSLSKTGHTDTHDPFLSLSLSLSSVLYLSVATVSLFRTCNLAAFSASLSLCLSLSLSLSFSLSAP